MNAVIKTLSVPAALLTLAGCVDFQLPQLPTLPTEAPITDSNDKICSEFKANKIRAKNLYVGKTFSFAAKLNNINENHEFGTYHPTYDLYFIIKKDNYGKSEQTISAQVLKTPSTERSITSISIGETVRVSGKIDSIDFYAHADCAISLRRASFSK